MGKLAAFEPERVIQEKGRVLVVDDDGAARRTITAILEGSVSVTAVPTIAAGWSELERDAYDVVVSDHELGAGTGVAFLGELARRSPLVARILLTGAVDSPPVKRLAAQARDDGLTLVLYKPVDPEDLLSWVGNGIAMARLARARARFATEGARR